MKASKIFLTLGLGALFLMAGCSRSTELLGSPSNGSSTLIVNSTTTVICNPFGPSNSVLQSWNGVQAKLSYVPTSEGTSFSGVTDFLSKSTSIDATLYLDEINTPTQLFNKGFTTKDGMLLKDSDGNTLFENFGLQIDTTIRLASWQKPGLRQFALLSDDGAVMKIDQGSGLTDFLSNDGVHATKMACANDAVWIGQDQDIPIHINYFQGPRNHIALMLLWRIVPDVYGTGEEDSPLLSQSALNDSACGTSGNDTFFNPNVVPSAPTAAWNQLRANGWEVVPAINYVLPGRAPVNPCK